MLINNSLKIRVLSYIVTFLVYAWLINWKAAIIIMAGVSFHEMGHLYAAEKLGKKTGGFFLIPFVGGVAISYGEPKSYSEQFYIYIMGPAAGCLLSTICAIIYMITGSQFIGEAAFFMFVLNLFNLLPFSFMDGGMIMRTFTYSISEKCGVYTNIITTILGMVALSFVNPILPVLIFFFGLREDVFELMAFKDKCSGKSYLVPDKYLHRLHKLPVRKLIVNGFVYLFLAGFMFMILIYLSKFGLSSMFIFKK